MSEVLASMVPPMCPEGARLVPLTRGLFAIVDEADYARVMAVKWSALSTGSGRFYARWKTPVALRLQYPPDVLMHRFVLDAPKHLSVDHINGDTLDNRRSINLRTCTHAENMGNSKAHTVPNRTASFKGVRMHPSCRSWQARITFRYREIYLGSYGTEIAAATAYDTAAKLYFGEFAHLNFPSHTQASAACASNNGAGELECPGTEGAKS